MASTIREALLRERYRGGQSYFVAPKVADLPFLERYLREQVPEVSFLTAHGQMAVTDLEDVMAGFYDGKADVLLSTTIVESGIDIPRANTLIVHRADMFGLAQLYQLRGRVGRSKTRAYCYLTTKPRAPLTPQAAKRLRLLGNLDSLGAGFNLASHDLDLRGAGNLLGEEQSGHIKEVGYELYQQMLEDAVKALRSGESLDTHEVADEWSPQIDIGAAVLIPEGYVEDLSTRLSLYRRLADLQTDNEREAFAAELIDRFGPLPPEAGQLLKVVAIKGLCREANVAKIDVGPKGAVVTFRNPRFLNAEDQTTLAGMETCVDLALLDDTVEVAVLRGMSVALDILTAAARTATPAEMARMRAMAHESLASGAIGVSTGTAYPPAACAPIPSQTMKSASFRSTR